MANFNLKDYETVEQRLLRFKQQYPNFRMESELVSHTGEVGSTRWVMKVTLWKDAADLHPVSTGFAFEVDGVGMAQRAAALETCETSALGRALANAGFVGNKRATREEMEKVQHREAGVRYYQGKMSQAKSLDELNALLREATQYGMQSDLQEIYEQQLKRVSAGGS